jgi:hypothetical protein
VLRQYDLSAASYVNSISLGVISAAISKYSFLSYNAKLWGGET